MSELIDAIATGAAVRYLFFWGHQPQRDGSIGSGCLSQWWPAAFTVDGLEYSTAEHYMMWRKAMLFGDATMAKAILDAPHPRRAKALGRRVGGFDQSTWDAQRFDIVSAASRYKFSAHPDLREFLLATRDRVLVEASPVDRVWGIGRSADDDGVADPANWRGLNLLGFALMRARAELASES